MKVSYLSYCRNTSPIFTVLERLTSKYLKKGAIDSTKSDASEDGRNETKLEEMQRRARECSEGTKGEGKQKV